MKDFVCFAQEIPSLIVFLIRCHVWVISLSVTSILTFSVYVKVKNTVGLILFVNRRTNLPINRNPTR